MGACAWSTDSHDRRSGGRSFRQQSARQKRLSHLLGLIEYDIAGVIELFQSTFTPTQMLNRLRSLERHGILRLHQAGPRCKVYVTQRALQEAFPDQWAAVVEREALEELAAMDPAP